MTNEQRKAIDNLSEIVKLSKEELQKENENITAILDYKDLKSLDTVLSLIKEHQEELKKQDRQIDLMAEWIEKHTKYYDEDGCYCEVEKEICKYDIECKDCIKQYFERKVKDVKD